MSELPSQRIDRSRKEARWIDGENNSSIEWYVDSEWVNVHSETRVGDTVVHVNNWIKAEQMLAILQTMGKI